VDITKELIQVIDESWARPECPPPYHIYVKMASLHEEDRLSIPKDDVQAREPKIICSLGIKAG
jgi:hypothetical protein